MTTDQTTTDEIRHLVQDFLAEPRHSDGGWAPVEPLDMKQLDGILYALIAAKWEKGPDGDYPIEHTLVDRTRYTRDGFFAIRYWHEACTEQERMSILRGCMTNALMAQERLDTALRLWMNEHATAEEEERRIHASNF